jgi:drug/metabolite transporter (DMT)-like permease
VSQQIASPRRKEDNLALGIGLTVLSVLIFGVQDALSKLLVQDISPFQVAMMRFWAFAPFALFLVARQAPLKQAFRSHFPALQVLRAVLLVADIWLVCTAMITMPLAELQAIMAIYPLLVTLMAIPILGEKVGVFRLTAVTIGFLGALIIVRPGGLPLDWGVAATVGSAVCYAIYLALTRKVSSHDSTATSMVYVGVFGFLLTSGVGIFFWQPMDMALLGVMVMVMITSIAAHGLMMLALSLAPASTVQPFNYIALPWGILMSIIFFQHFIDPIAMIGAAVIVGAGLVVMARERHLAKAGRATPPQPAEESPR